MVVAHKILVSAPVPWIGDLGTRDWGLGLDNNLLCILKKCYITIEYVSGQFYEINKPVDTQ